jgi:hypothetical protein
MKVETLFKWLMIVSSLVSCQNGNYNSRSTEGVEFLNQFSYSRSRLLHGVRPIYYTF